ncbi:MAG: twin-arginine translocase TatA/TatE family subunit [Actinomycetota bacterium]|nr:twin-arginine translocase TatA/TatE family subunit [Actinomycetota bacterium]
MFNIGGGEFLIILLVVLVFLGPSKLPEIARTLGKFASSIRQMNISFQDEINRSYDEPIEEAARLKGKKLAELDAENPKSRIDTATEDSTIGDENE